MFRTLMVLVLGAMSVAGQEYPHAFPRQGAVQLIDNERVTVWEVTWLRGVKQPLHRHRYDMAGVYLRYGPIRVTSPDGSVVVPQPFEAPWAYFQKKGRTHREEADDNPANPEELAIMTDLKEVTVEPFPVPPGLVAAFPRAGARNALENDRVRMWDYTWPEGKELARHAHRLDSVEVFVEGGTIQTTYADGRTESREFHAKDARFVPRGTVDSENALKGRPRAVIVELK